MSTPTTTDPPYVPIRHSGWPVRRTPLWVLLALVLLAGGVVLVALSHKPSHAQEAGDLTAYINDMNTAVESCAGGVRESQQALSVVQSDPTASVKIAIGLVGYNANNCTPASNELLADLTQYQVTESLARFHLPDCTNDFVTWSFDAAQVQEDMIPVMRAPAGPARTASARTASARTAATATLRRDLGTLNAERATIYSILRSAEHAVSDNAPLPSLPG